MLGVYGTSCAWVICICSYKHKNVLGKIYIFCRSQAMGGFMAQNDFMALSWERGNVCYPISRILDAHAHCTNINIVYANIYGCI